MAVIPLSAFLSGGVMLANGVISLIFWRFFQRTRVQLFFYFSMAFGLLAIERVFLLASIQSEPKSWVYLIRLVAFTMVIYGIIKQNRRENALKS